MGTSSSKGLADFRQIREGQWQNQFTDLEDADFLVKLNKEIGSMPNGDRKSKALEIVFELGKDQHQQEEITNLSFVVLVNSGDEEKYKKLIFRPFVQERLLNGLNLNTDRLSREDVLYALKRIVTDDDISYVIAQSMLDWLMEATRTGTNLTDDNLSKFNSVLNETLSQRKLLKEVFRISACQANQGTSLKPNLQHEEQSRNIETQRNYAAESQERGKTTDHVMISYNRENKEIAFALESILVSHGINTWMNRNNQKLKLIKEIAVAVENCSHFLSLVSSHYKQSVYCKMEAKYAVELEKTIIPVHVEEGFVPSGWIGKITSGSLFYKFFHQDDVTSDKCEALIRCLTAPHDSKSEQSRICALM